MSMFGKHFENLYERSMVGKGAMMFAVWGYVIAKQKPSRAFGSVVTLNSTILGSALGEPAEEVENAITKLCAPDPASTSPEEEGRRLVKIGAFEYRVVNGAKYRAIRDEESLRESNRVAQRKHREKKSKTKPGTPLPGEVKFEAAVEAGATEEEENTIVSENL